MMGPRQGALFYEFSIDDHVPADHLLRCIDRFVDLGDVRRHLAPFYSTTGRPSVDPELMIRTLIVGYAFGIRSARRLCEEVHLNLKYRWFCRLDVTDLYPTTRSSRRTGTGGSAKAISSGICSRAWLPAVSPRDLSGSDLRVRRQPDPNGCQQTVRGATGGVGPKQDRRACCAPCCARVSGGA